MTKSLQSDLTRSVEDYLKTIYHLTEAGDPASTTDLAGALAVAAPSVSGMLRRLSEQGFVVHERYRGATLTPTGLREALRVLRRHRVIESYLVDQLGYSWDAVHHEAERLEHAASDDLVERMAEALGNPAFDPHGDPIPSADGTVSLRETIRLSEVSAGTEVRIVRVDTDDPGRLRWLAEQGLTPGVRVTVETHQPFGGPVTVLRDRVHLVVGREIAGHLRCMREVPR